MIRIAPNGERLDLGCVDSWRLDDAVEIYDRGDGEGFGCLGYSRGASLALVCDNAKALQTRGIYESALVSAYVGCKANNGHWATDMIALLFSMADRAKLRAVGATLPGPGPFTVYRGVSGIGRRRRLNGFSWTLDLDTACWFACRNGLANPAVMTATVGEEDVLCYYAERGEHEIICAISKSRRLKISIAEMQAARERVHAARAAENAAMLSGISLKKAGNDTASK